MSRLALAAALLLSAGCASGPPPAPPAPVRFAAIAAPLLGPPESSDALYQVVDALSLQTDLELVLVVGPLYGAGKAQIETTRAELLGALGSLACPVHVALGPLDLERDPELLEQLDLALPQRPAELAYRAHAPGIELEVLGPGGEAPEDAAEGGEPGDRALVLGGPPEADAGGLRVTHGPTLTLTSAQLEVPALGSGEPLYVLGTFDRERGRVRVRLRAGEEDRGEALEAAWD